MKQSILKEIENWFERMIHDYPPIKFKYEFNKEDGIYKIIYYVNVSLSNDDNFNREVLKFEDYMNAVYGIKAPLFCENDELFTLSSEACGYPYAQIQEDLMPKLNYTFEITAEFFNDYSFNNHYNLTIAA